VTYIVQKTQRSNVNFKSIRTVLLETLSGRPILPIFDVHRTPPFSGFHKLNVDVASPIERGKWGIGVAVKKNKGVVVDASCRQVFSLPFSEVARALTMRKSLKFVKYMSFLNLIYSRIRCFLYHLDVECLSTIFHLCWFYYWRIY
jgi:hypothetical protein